jgi:hypothetical protein
MSEGETRIEELLPKAKEQVEAIGKSDLPRQHYLWARLVYYLMRALIYAVLEVSSSIDLKQRS